MQLRNLFEEQRPKPAFSGWTKQKTFIGVPLLIVLVCAVYLVGKCYPSAVFLWGDEVEDIQQDVADAPNCLGRYHQPDSRRACFRSSS
jgi:hypothetical protein